MESCEHDKGEKGNISGGGGSNIDGSLSSSSNTTNSRWNPTKEQISMLENLYSQGIRTPSAEQIQQITSRLSVYGHIEGKNVFYWFQNHKARQRQKQKQQNLAYINRFLHETTPPPIFTIPPYPCPNVVCSPYLIPLNSSQDSVLPPQYHSKVPFVIPNGIKRRQRDAHKLENLKTSFDEFVVHETNNNGDHSSSTRRDEQQTLALFPLHPTGIIDQQTKQNPPCSSDQIDVGPTSTTMSNHQPAYYYDFLSSAVHSCCESTDHFNLS